MTYQYDQLRNQLSVTATTLANYGFLFWTDKLNELLLASATAPQEQVISKIASLYGGFGTLMDLAVDPYMLPDGISEDSANQELLKSINDLYDYVKRA